MKMAEKYISRKTTYDVPGHGHDSFQKKVKIRSCMDHGLMFFGVFCFWFTVAWAFVCLTPAVQKSPLSAALSYGGFVSIGTYVAYGALHFLEKRRHFPLIKLFPDKTSQKG
jgi:hypothetical protein